MKKEKLLECPFCGKNEGYLHYNSNVQDSYLVECSYCCGSAPTGYNKQEAISAWNARAKPPITDAMVEAAYKAYSNYADNLPKDGIGKWTLPEIIQFSKNRLIAALKAAREVE